MAVTVNRWLKINQDGSSCLVTQHEEPRQASEGILASLACSHRSTLKSAFNLGENTVSLSYNENEMMAVTRITKLNLVSFFELGADKLLHPLFIDKKDPRGERMPVISAVWNVPESMLIMFSARVYNYKTKSGELSKTSSDQSCFLVAFNKIKQAWLMPLPNLFDDATICMGSFDGSGPSIQAAVGLALNQFQKSEWNSDLIGERQQNSRKLFSFSPTGEGVESVPFDGDWTKLCTRIATPVTELIGGML